MELLGIDLAWVRIKRRPLILLLSATAGLFAGNALAREPASRHVVLVVWDGMRPDFATEKYAPTLAKLAGDGIRFRNHHSVYPTATNVNGAALATGCYPDKNWLCANLEFRPSINPRQPIDTSDPDSIRRGDEVSAGKHLAVPTFVELLRAEGKTVALAGTKSVVLLFDRHNDWTIVPMQERPLTVFAGAPIKATQRDELTRMLGAFVDDPKALASQRNDFATRALTDFLWRDAMPDFSLLWLSEPDLSEHNFGPGSPQAIAGIKAVDADLQRLLNTLEQKHVRDATEVLLVSDHGFSTIRRAIDVIALLNTAGFRAGKQMSDAAKPGDIIVAGNAGTLLFYVHDHQRKTTERLVDWLEHSDFAGEIFTRDKLEGTFPLDAVRIATPAAPDVVMGFRFYNGKNQFGIPGIVDADWNRPAGEGTHATLGVTDVHNTFIAAGPDFRGGEENNVATGNIDIAPTILALLAVKGPGEMDGRVLVEKSAPAPARKHLEASRALDHGSWRQSLGSISIGRTTYFEPFSKSRD